MIFDENKGLIKEDGDLEWTPIFGNNINEVVDNLLNKGYEQKQKRMDVNKPLSKSNFGGR